MSELQHRFSWMYQGHHVHPLAMSPEEVRLSDISRGLAHTARWNGHTAWPYSVAQHAVMVSDLAAQFAAVRFPHDAEYAMFCAALLGLHHDDAEAYLGDTVAPIKDLLYVDPRDGSGSESFWHAENRSLRVIARGLRLEFPNARVLVHPTEGIGVIVDHADKLLAVSEARHLVGVSEDELDKSPWVRAFVEKTKELYGVDAPEIPVVWGPRRARWEWERKHCELLKVSPEARVEIMGWVRETPKVAYDDTITHAWA